MEKLGFPVAGDHNNHHAAPHIPIMPQVPFHGQSHESMPGMPQEPRHSGHAGTGSPGFAAPPASGYRIPLTTTAAFPAHQQVGQAPCTDLDGSPVYFGSALFEHSVHPCKVGPHLNPPCMVPYGGSEHAHHGRYDLLPFDYNTMELVPTSYGQIPNGRRPIEGGYEEHSAKLYHAIAVVNGVRVPGKTGVHLGGANVSFGGAEHTIIQNYEILCWK